MAYHVASHGTAGHLQPYHPHSEPPDHEREDMPEDEIRYWWVNQGQSHAVETNEEFLFANLVAIDGRTVPGYDAMGRLSIGDVVLHYFKGHVQAVSSIKAAPSVQAHPHDPSREGRLAKIGIHWLTSPIALSEIPLDVRAVEVPDGPFTIGGAVQQGYLRPVSKEFVDKLVTMYPDRFPPGSPMGTPGSWDRFAHFARLFYEDDEFFEADERRYKRTIADKLEQAITAFRTAPRPTEDDALSEEQRAKYLEAENPAQAARVLGVSERRYRDLLRAQDVYVSRGGQFDEAIRMQVLPAALELSGARRQGDWRHQLKRAFGPPNNMTAWQAHDSLLKWLRANPADAEAAMNSLLSEDATPAEAIRGFCRAVPPDVVSGRASRLAVASFILYGTRPDDLPPFRNSLLISALEVLEQGSVATGLDEGALYEESLGLLDRTMAECEARGLTIRNRIDTQGILWCVISDTVDPLSSWSPEDRQGLLDFRAGKGPVNTELEDPVSDDLAALVQRFRDETGYPTDLHRKKLAERDMLAAALTPEALEAPDGKVLHQLASRTYIGPGVMPAFNATVSAEGGPEAAGQALSHLLYGDGDEATRITSVADGAHKVPGMRGAIATKALSIVYPDRWIPVCGVSGVKGKKAMIRRLDLEPLEPGPVGNEVEVSNERLFRALAPHFGTDTYGMSRFLFWELEREEAPEGPTLAGLAAELFRAYREPRRDRTSARGQEAGDLLRAAWHREDLHRSEARGVPGALADRRHEAAVPPVVRVRRFRRRVPAESGERAAGVPARRWATEEGGSRGGGQHGCACAPNR